MTVSAAAVAERPNKYDTCVCGATKRTAAVMCRACRNTVQKLPIASRFWPSVDVRGPDECWEWTGNTNGRYGIVFKAKVNGKPTWAYAHRLSYEMAGFVVAADEHVDHLCSNKTCVNPAHLEAVRPLENRRRYHARINAVGRTTGPEPSTEEATAK